MSSKTWLWEETFDDLLHGTILDEGDTAWSVDISETQTPIFEVQDQKFFAQNTDGVALWRSEKIDISSADVASFSLDIWSQGNLEATGSYADFIEVSYLIDGQEISLTRYDGILNSDNLETVGTEGLKGKTLQLVIRTKTTGGDEAYLLDNLSVSGDTSTTSGDPSAPFFWQENFDGLANGTTVDTGTTAWGIDISQTDNPIFEVKNNAFISQNTDGLTIWQSEVIDISSASSINFSLDIQGEGGLESSGSYTDSLSVSYLLDGNKVNIVNYQGMFNSGQVETLKAEGLSGNSFQILIETNTTARDELYRWDNLTVTAAESDTTTDTTTNTTTDTTTDPHPDDPDKASEHMALFKLVPHSGATHVAVNNGSWFDPSTWQGRIVPGDNADVLISEGVQVIYDAESDARLHTVRVDGTLDFAHNQNTKMVVDTFVVDSKGTLLIGTKDKPIQGNKTARIIIADNGAIDLTWDPEQLSRGLISHGTVEIHGQEKTSHLKLAQDPIAGDQEMLLAEAPINWKVGDSIVLTGTHYVPWKWNGQELEYMGTQDEELKIVAIDGKKITVDRPLEYNHNTPKDNLKAYVANYSRNVVFETKNHESLPANQRGHVMFMHSRNVDVRYAEFHELGRTDKSKNLDDFLLDDNGKRILDQKGEPIPGERTNIRGRYAVHFHRNGADDANSEPAVGIGNAVWGSPGWGYVHHDSYVLLENNAAYNVFGSAFVSETGNEIGAWNNNIAIKSEGRNEIAKVGARNHDVARNGSGFWFQGRLVENANNVAAGMSGHGFVYFHRGIDQMDVSAQALSNPEIARYQESVNANIPPIQDFFDNEAFALGKGLEVIKANQKQSHDLRSTMKGFTAWEVQNGFELQYTAHYTLQDFTLIGAESSSKTGARLGRNAEDIVLDGAYIEGFDKGAEATKKNTLGDLDNNHYALIDTTFVNNEQDLSNFDPTIDEILTGADLSPNPLTLAISPDADLFFDQSQDDRRVEIEGIKTDSIGAIEHLAGHDSASVGFTEITNRINQGYYSLKDGTRIFTIEELVADRVTGEFKKVSIPIIIDPDLDMRWDLGQRFKDAPHLGEYDPLTNPDGADVDILVTQTVKNNNTKVIGTSSTDLFEVDPNGFGTAIIHGFEDDKDKLLLLQDNYQIVETTANGVGSASISFDTGESVILEGVLPSDLSLNL